MQDSQKDKGTECSSEGSGNSASYVISTTCCGQLQPTDISQSVESTIISVSSTVSTVSSTSVNTSMSSTRRCDGPSLCDYQVQPTDTSQFVTQSVDSSIISVSSAVSSTSRTSTLRCDKSSLCDYEIQPTDISQSVTQSVDSSIISVSSAVSSTSRTSTLHCDRSSHCDYQVQPTDTSHSVTQFIYSTNTSASSTVSSTSVTSTLHCDGSSLCDYQVQPTDTSQSVTQSIYSTNTSVSSTVSSTPGTSTLHCDESSLCDSPPVIPAGILEAAALLSGITQDTIQGVVANTDVPEGEISVSEDESQIRVSLLQRDNHPSDIYSDNEASDDEVKLGHKLHQSTSKDYEADSESGSSLTVSEDGSSIDGRYVEVNTNHDVSKGYEADTESNGCLSTESDIGLSDSDACSSNGEQTPSDSDSIPVSSRDKSDADIENSSTNEYKSSDSGSSASDYNDDPSTESIDEDNDGIVSHIPRIPLHKASDILASSSFYNDVASEIQRDELTKKRKREGDMPERLTKKRKMYSPEPGTCKGITKSRKHRTSSQFERDKFPPPKAKRRKLSLHKQCTYQSCPNKCPCKTRGRDSRIQAIERTFKVTQPLYKKLLKSKVMDTGNLSEYRCCNKYCMFRWFRNRIPCHKVMADYWSSDLDVCHFSWGHWKDGEGHVIN